MTPAGGAPVRPAAQQLPLPLPLLLLLCCALAIRAGAVEPSEIFVEAGAGAGAEADAEAASRSSLRGPHFDTAAARNVTALVGRTARLHCRIHNLGNRTVSWVRHRDIHLLTVGRYTYTSDQRFQAVHAPQSDDWTLQIRYPQRRDSGMYECQVSTTPPIGLPMYLTVVEPVTVIMGEPEMFINKGSTINLTCVVRHAAEPPTDVEWTHNDQEINFDSPRGGVSVVTEKNEVTTSYLLIQKAQPPDSGRYTCHPLNTISRSIAVHVLDGEHPAAMQHGGQCLICCHSQVSLFVALAALAAAWRFAVPGPQLPSSTWST